MSVSLKKGQSVSLAKKNNGYEDIVINLKWDQGITETKGGFFKSLFGKNKAETQSIDLDLGCLFELKNGSKGAVQALGNSFGSLDKAPYIKLDGDDRTGESNDGETLRINGHKWSEISRVLVYSFIYAGVAKWSEANGIVRLNSQVEELEITLDNSNNSDSMCGIALIENINGDMKVTKVNDYYKDHVQLDRAFKWNLNWRAGSK